jgi:hypothetical protein
MSPGSGRLTAAKRETLKEPNVNRRYAGSVLLALLLLVPAAVQAQEQGYPFKWSNFQIELTGGWAKISPDSLNRTVTYENTYLTHYYLNRYAYYDGLYGDAYSAQYVYAGDKEFKPLEAITPLGAAIRYQASPTFALSLGVQYLRGVSTSGVDLDVLVDDARAEAALPGASTAHYSNSDLTVSVKAWMPYLGANFGWDLFHFLRTELYLLGGPIMGDLRAWDQRNESLTTAEGTVSSGSRTFEMTGDSTSLAIEAGAQLRAKILPFVDIFVQAGYSFRQLNQIQGLETIVTKTDFPAVSETDYALAGTWGVTWEKFSDLWGEDRAPTMTTDYAYRGRDYVGTTTASIDLSGLQLTAGISIRL